MSAYPTLILCLLHISKLWLIMHDFTSFFQVHTSKSRHKNSPSLHLKHLCIFFWTMHCLIFLHIIYNFVNNNTKYKDWCVLFYALNYFTLWFSFLSSGRRMSFSEDYGTKINPNLGLHSVSFISNTANSQPVSDLRFSIVVACDRCYISKKSLWLLLSFKKSNPSCCLWQAIVWYYNLN